jgi:large subunit ribosomal protein L3
MNGLLGTKLGMAQHFGDDGRVIPVTLIRVGPCVVVQKKTVDADGYEAVQVGLERSSGPRSRPTRNRALAGRLAAAGAPSASELREFQADSGDDLQVGSRLGAEVFSPNEVVRITGISKGKGFAGVMKRHGFSGGPKSHGSKFHRAPGAIGMCATPSRVLPGTRLPGQHGRERVTVRNLRIVRVDTGENVVAVRGAVPGPRGATVEIRKS